MRTLVKDIEALKRISNDRYINYVNYSSITKVWEPKRIYWSGIEKKFYIRKLQTCRVNKVNEDEFMKTGAGISLSSSGLFQVE